MSEIQVPPGHAPRILICSTVVETIVAFLLPHASFLTSLGFEVSAAASGANWDSLPPSAAFEALYDLQIPRNPRALIQLVKCIPRIWRVVDRRNFEVIHVHTPIAAFLIRGILLLKRGHSRPILVYTVHGFHFHSGRGILANAAFVLAERAVRRGTDFMIVINREDFEQALRLRLVPRNSLYLIDGVGVDLESYSLSFKRASSGAQLRSELGIGILAPVILMVAEFTPNKRHADALRAFSMIMCRGAHLVLVGKGPTLSGAVDLARDLGLADRVHFLGFRVDVPDLLAASRLVLLTSGREGLPRALMEAMAMGRPFVGTDVRGVRDLAPSTAVLAGVGDARGLASRIDWLLSDSEAWRELAEACQSSVHRYAIESVLEQLRPVYELILHVCRSEQHG